MVKCGPSLREEFGSGPVVSDQSNDWSLVFFDPAQHGRDVTALPYGISTPVLFLFLFGVMLPVKLVTGDAVLAWQVGIAAGVVGGLVEMLGAVIGPWLKRVTPRAGMLGTLSGIALVFIATVAMARIYESPIIGFTALAVASGYDDYTVDDRVEIAVVAASVAHFRRIEASSAKADVCGESTGSSWKRYGGAKGWRR